MVTILSAYEFSMTVDLLLLSFCVTGRQIIVKSPSPAGLLAHYPRAGGGGGGGLINHNIEGDL